MALRSSRSHQLLPAVGFAHSNHLGKDLVVGFLLQENLVGEQTAVPADVAKGLDWVAFAVAHPVAGVADDVQFAVLIIHRAVLARIIVIAATFHSAIVLSDVEVDRPWTE